MDAAVNSAYRPDRVIVWKEVYAGALSAEMMLRHIGWLEAADLLIASMEHTIRRGTVTRDFAHAITEATELSTSDFGGALVAETQALAKL